MTRGFVLLLAAAVALVTGCASLTERSPESSAPEHELFIGLTEDGFKLVH